MSTSNATPRARVSVRRSTYRGKPGWTISGKDQLGRRVKIFSERQAEARRMASEIRAGESPRFDFESASAARVMNLDPLKEPREFAEKLADWLGEHAKKLIDTADGLAAWVYGERTGRRSKIEVHPSHAANRLRKMAREIAGGEK